MLWTFDPLVARNAHFNINRLGARIAEYVPNFYGANTGSVLHGGLPTDRFVTEWDLTKPAKGVMDGAGARSSSRSPNARLVNLYSGDHVGLVDPLPDEPSVLIQIPHDIELVHALGEDTAFEWRMATRAAFTHYLSHGYRVAQFDRGDEVSLPVYQLEHTSTTGG
jgi:predicted GNAT superfamily acetyltransferase